MNDIRKRLEGIAFLGITEPSYDKEDIAAATSLLDFTEEAREALGIETFKELDKRYKLTHWISNNLSWLSSLNAYERGRALRSHLAILKAQQRDKSLHE